MNNFKLGIKTLRYGSGIVYMTICGIIFFPLGLLMSIWDKVLGVAGLSGDVLMVLLAMFPAQVIYSLSASNFVQSSPVKKRMQTSVPATVTCIYMIALYLLNSLINGIMIMGHPEYTAGICREMVTMAAFVVFIMVSIGVAYKHFWVSIILGIAVYFMISSRMTLVNELRFGVFGNDPGSFVLALVLGLVIIVIGGFGQYGASLLVYKAPMSKYSQSAAVRKEM